MRQIENLAGLLQEIMRVTLRSTPTITNYYTKEVLRGGCVRVCDPNGSLLAHFPIGLPTDDAVLEYSTVADKTIEELLEDPDAMQNWTRDEVDEGETGAAIRLPDSHLIIAVVGWSREFSLAYCLVLARHLKLIDNLYVVMCLSNTGENSKLYGDLYQQLGHVSSRP